jgi:hypothetical protein
MSTQAYGIVTLGAQEPVRSPIASHLPKIAR